MIFLFTDFGLSSPYVGQVKAVLARGAPHVPVIEMFSDLPAFDPKSAAYLLPAYSQQAQPGDVVMAVVDPGVGTARACVALNADGIWYVGPDNGSFAIVARRAKVCVAWQLAVPATASATFHGRDVFAPVAASLALGHPPQGQPIDAKTLDRPTWPDDLAAVIYIDHYGNALTGLRVNPLKPASRLGFGNKKLHHMRTFTDAQPAEAFMYANSNGLWEIAVRDGNAGQALGLTVGAILDVDGLEVDG